MDSLERHKISLSQDVRYTMLICNLDISLMIYACFIKVYFLSVCT